jgi:NADH-quinone oxidoreductase subunit L
MPQTYLTFVIGSLALAGIFPLAGFWSKDEILVTADAADYSLFFWVGLVGALMTAAYMTRCIWYTFFGEYRGGHDLEAGVLAHVDAHGDTEHGHAEDAAGDVDLHADAHGSLAEEAHGDDAHHGEPHESPPSITGPLWVLTFFSVTAGFLNAAPFGIEKFKEWFEPTVAFPVEEIVHAEFSWAKAGISVAVALLGIALSYGYYWRGLGPQRLTERNGVARAGKHLLVKKYYLDDLYEKVIVGAIKGPVARATYWFNQHVIDNVLNYTGRGARVIGRFTYDYIDQRGVDGIVNGIGAATDDVGGAARQLQTGRLQFYAWMLVTAVAAFGLALFIAS